MGLLGLLLPSRCAGCEVPGVALCDACRDALVRVAPPVCERCGCPGTWPVLRCVECSGRRLGFARARAALVYEARARALVSAWKERGRRELAAVLAGLVGEVVARPVVAALTFVPGDRERGDDGACDDLPDEAGELAASTLLPGRDERSRRCSPASSGRSSHSPPSPR